MSGTPRIWAGIALTVGILAGTWAQAETGLWRHKKMYAVPVPSSVEGPAPKVTVDGDKRWDADACQFRMSIDPKLG